jgi:hypothetical protein
MTETERRKFDHEELEHARRELGKIVIMAQAKGSERGLMIMASRAYVEDMFGEFVGMSAMRQRRETDATVRNVSRAVRRWLTQDQPADPAFLTDLIRLFVIKTITGKDCGAAGLKNLLLAIGMDETLPWDRRGLLDPEFMSVLGLYTDPPRIVAVAHSARRERSEEST